MNKTINQIILEEIANKKLFNAMFAKWKQENQNISEDEVEGIFNRFAEIKNGLSIKRPQVITFLNYFDGNPGKLFDPKFLKDITKYSYQQIKFLINEYSDDEFDDDVVADNTPKDFGKIGSSLNKENVEASKKLWEGDNFAIINEEGFRVYKIPNQQVAIMFGYYLDSFNESNKEGYEQRYHYADIPVWCVSRRENSNMWAFYRTNRTFYFIIDESKKGVNNSKYYLGALQFDSNEHTNYRLTDRFNSGDTLMNWEEVVEIYPKLQNHKNKIVPENYDEEEIKEKSKISHINESNGPNGFIKQPFNIKRLYIINGGLLSKPESWQSMNPRLRILYINSIETHNYRSKIPNYAFLLEIKKVNNEYKTLDRRLDVIGLNGVSTLIEHFLLSEFKPDIINIENPNIKVYQSKRTGKVGIFDTTRGEWYKKGGVEYGPHYDRPNPRLFINTNDTTEKFFMLAYHINKNEDNNSYYCLIPIKKSKRSGHFFSAQAFEKIKDTIVDKSTIGRLAVDTDNDADIKEIKGVK